MEDLSREKVAEAISMAGMEIGKLDISEPEDFFKERERVIILTITDFLKINQEEPLFEIIKDSLDKAIKFCPD